MILHDKLDRPYDQCTIRTMIWLKCDYCGVEFQRVKKSIPRLNKVIDKDSCGSKECTSKKREEGVFANYGETTYFKTKQFDEQKKQSCLERYGTEQYFASDDAKEKRKETLIERYGTDSPLRNEEIKQKQRETCKDLYGVENYSQTEECRKKVKKTSLERYGVENACQLPETIEKRRQTSLERYGVTDYCQTDEYWERREKTCLEKYGVDHVSKSPEIRKKALQTSLERYGKEHYSQTDECKQTVKSTCMERYGVPCPLALPENRLFGKAQNELGDWLNSMGFEFKTDYQVLEGREIDLYDSNLKLGIEYCGLYWHNEMSSWKKDEEYHYTKYKNCLAKGVRLITLFDDEWKTRQDQCKNILMSIVGKHHQKVFARKCKFIELGKSDFNSFCEEYHLLGKNNLGLVFFGLEHGGELVGVMSLGRHHRKSEVVTLDRLCFKTGVQVVGGASKLFDRCIKWAKEQKIQQILSWSDNRWSQGGIYERLGFKLEEEIRPDYSYVKFKGPATSRISKQSQMKSLTGCPKEVTEREWALEHGLARIWDCGKMRWVFEIFQEVK